MILNLKCNCIWLEENVMNATLYYGRIEMESIDHKDLLAVIIDREKNLLP